jgi:hypothetical protein
LVALLGVPTLAEELSPQMKGAQDRKAMDIEIRDNMKQISRQLGVSCTTCHNSKNFKDDAKREFKIAKDHLRITQLLIDSGFNGQNKQPKADCYMCHRGHLNMPYKEPFDALTMDPLKTRDGK